LLCFVGQANLALGRHAEPTTAFQAARAAALAIDINQRYDAAIGLAQIASAQHDVAGAMSAIEESPAHLAARGTLEGTEQPRPHPAHRA